MGGDIDATTLTRDMVKSIESHWLMWMKSIDGADQHIAICQAVHQSSFVASAIVNILTADCFIRKWCPSPVWKLLSPMAQGIRSLFRRCRLALGDARQS